MRLRGIVLGVLVAIALYLSLWPVPVDPAAWNAPVDAGYVGPFARNERLRELELLPIGGDHGPETIDVDAQGRVYAGTKEGRILRDGQVWATTGGRPLGLRLDGDGSLLVADGMRGLLRVMPDGRVLELARVAYANSVDVAPDGRVYFTDATAKFAARDFGGPFEASLADLMEHRGHGRLLVYDPRTNATSTVLGGLHFANGVALAPDGSFALVADMSNYRIVRHWLAGPRRGQTEAVIENLPGFPDNLSTGRDGRFWIGLVTPRNPIVDRLSGWPRVRAALWRLPKALRPKPVLYGHVVAIDGNGRVLASLQDPTGRFPLTTHAKETEQFLYVGSLEADAIWRMQPPL
jgi:sugar lactone lactonase YvrE